MKGLNQFLNIVIVLGCLVFGFFFYEFGSNKVAKTDQSSLSPAVDPQDLANKYMQEVQKDLTAQKINATLNMKKSELQKNQPEKVVETNPADVPIEQQIWSDPNEQAEVRRPIEKKFTDDLNRSKYNQMQDEADRKEYIRQYKENARRNGYEITLSDDLEVTKVVPIRKPQNQNNDYDANQSDPEY